MVLSLLIENGISVALVCRLQTREQNRHHVWRLNQSRPRLAPQLGKQILNSARVPCVHNRVHVWVGGDMLPSSSPTDPVFYMNHCNIDRIWEAWLKGTRQDLGTSTGRPCVIERTPNKRLDVVINWRHP